MPFPIEPQEQSDWCWAAVTESVDHYFNSKSTLSQCRIANEVLNGDCCNNPVSCNFTMKLQDVLDHFDRLEGDPRVGSPDFSDIKRELKANRPVAVRIAWFGGGAHFVVICGYRESLGAKILEIADPFYGDLVGGEYFGIWEIDHDLFPEWYQQGGAWSATFFLKP